MGLYEVTEMRYRVNYNITYYRCHEVIANDLEEAKRIFEQELQMSEALDFKITSIDYLGDGRAPIPHNDLINQSNVARAAIFDGTLKALDENNFHCRAAKRAKLWAMLSHTNDLHERADILAEIEKLESTKR